MKKNFKLIICLICSLALMLIGFSLNLTGIISAKAEENNNLSRLDDYMKKLKASAPIPGISVVVVKGNEIIYSKGFGEEIIGLNKPMTENSSTAIGSLTKSFTAMAVMQLVEQEKINLDDPVIKYIPEFRTLDKEKSDKITVRMLLSHTSGIASMDKWINMPDASVDAMERGVKELSSFPLNRDPGEYYEYSNEGFDTAGIIIERVSGMKYPEYIEKNILEPLKMDKSTTDINKFDELNVLYGHNPGIEKAIPAGHFINTSALAAGSEFRSSTENLGHYLIALLNSGKYEGSTVLSKESIEELWKPQVSFPSGPLKGIADDGKLNYCLGWMSSTLDGRRIIHHGGNTRTASSYTMLYPEKKIAVSILYNLNMLNMYKYIGMHNVTNNILHIVSGEQINDTIFVDGSDPTSNSYELPSGQNSAYVGEYISSTGDYTVEVSEVKGSLVSKLKNSTGTSEYILDFASPTAVYFRNISITYPGQFKIASDGRVTGIEINGLGSLSKLNEDMYADYNKVHSPDNKTSFYIPKDCVISWDNDKCLIESPDKKILIQGEIKDKELDGFNGFVKSSSDDAEIVKENLEHTENIAGHLFREKSFTIKNGDSLRLRMLLYTEIDDSSISFSTDLSYPESGEITRDAILPIMYSLK